MFVVGFMVISTSLFLHLRTILSHLRFGLVNLICKWGANTDRIRDYRIAHIGSGCSY